MPERALLDEAREVYERFRSSAPPYAHANVANVLMEALVTQDREADARDLLESLPDAASEQDAVDTAILARRLREQRAAHRYFQRAGDAVFRDPRALHEFAQTKMRLAQDAMRQRSRGWRDVNSRLLGEARELLERVVQMDATPTRHAWAWRDLARTLNWMRAPASDVEAAFEAAIELLPQERRFPDELVAFRARRAQRGRPASRDPSGKRRNKL